MTNNNDDFPRDLRTILKAKYFPTNLRIRSEDTRRQYGFALGNLDEFLGHPATIDDLSDDNICGMMVRLLDAGLSPATVNDRRIRVNALWGWLARKGHVKTFPCNAPIDEPDPDPVAWTRDEMRRLVEAADVFIDGQDRKRLGSWWRALFAVAWDTGGRTGELLALRWEWIDWQTGMMRVPAIVRKGKKKAAIYRLKRPTLDALNKLEPLETGSIFRLNEMATYYARYRKLLGKAGIPQNRKNGLQKWRRSHATYLELAGGDGTKALGHNNRETTTRSYLDPIILAKPQNDLLFPLGSADAETG